MSRKSQQMTSQTSNNQTNSQQNIGIFPPIEQLQQFRACLLMTLAKFGDSQTQRQAQEEVKELMTEHITNTDRMNTFLFMLADHNEHMKPAHKRELIKIYAQAAEIFEEALIAFLPKILSYLSKKLKETDPSIQIAVADSLGSLVHHVLKKIDNLEDLLREFNPFLKMIFTNLQSANKPLQVGAAVCLTRIIQNAPVLLLQSTLQYISSKLLECISSQSCKCHTQVLECLISLVLAVEGDFSQYAAQFLPHLLECMTHDDWTVRKMSVDVIYTMAAILKEVLSPFKQEILDVLNTARTDKQKPVREATLEAIQAVRDIPGANEGFDDFRRQIMENIESESDKKPQYRRNQRDSSPIQQQPAARPMTSNRGQSRKPVGATPTGQMKSGGGPKGNTTSAKSFNQPSENVKSDTESNLQSNRRTLTSATQKKMAREQEKSQNRTMSMPNQQPGSFVAQQKKSSILRGPKNSNFFKKQEGAEDGIQILEGPLTYHPLQNNHEENKEDEQAEDISIKIYEGKKLPPYRDPQRLEERIQYSNQKANSSKKSSPPVKKSFLEHSDISAGLGEHTDDRDNEQIKTTDSLNVLGQEQQQLNDPKDDKSFQSPAKYQQPKQNQKTISFQQPQPNEYLQQQPQYRNIPSSFAYTQENQIMGQQIPQPYQPIFYSNDQQVQFLIQEIQKMHQQQTIMFERMTEYQNQHKQEIFTLQARIAKLEDHITQQQKLVLNPTSPYLQQVQPFTSTFVPQQVPIQNMTQLNNEQFQIGPTSTKSDILANGRNKWNNLLNKPTTAWQNIQDRLNKQQVNDAYRLLLTNDTDQQSGEEKELLLIKLIGKTGVCLDKLDQMTVDQLLNKIIQILSKKEFIEVLLPWLSTITKHLTQNGKGKPQINLNTLSNLIECLLLLLNDDSANLNEQQRQDISFIYESLSESLVERTQ